MLRLLRLFFVAVTLLPLSSALPVESSTTTSPVVGSYDSKIFKGTNCTLQEKSVNLNDTINMVHYDPIISKTSLMAPIDSNSILAFIVKGLLKQKFKFLMTLLAREAKVNGPPAAALILNSMRTLVNKYSGDVVFEDRKSVFHDLAVIFDFSHRIVQKRYQTVKSTFGKMTRRNVYVLDGGQTVEDLSKALPSAKVKGVLSSILLSREYRQDVFIVPLENALNVTVIARGEIDGEIIDFEMSYVIPKEFADIISEVS
jgi:hypothetical protein